MKTKRRLHLLAVLAILLGAAVVFTPAANALPKIHSLLIVMDGDTRMSQAFEISRNKIQNLLSEVRDVLGISLVPGYNLYQYQRHLFSAAGENRPTRSNIMQWFREVRPGPDDVVFVYFCGHGGAYSNRELYLSLVGGELIDRKELVKAMERIKCRLKILATDACSYGGANVRAEPDVAPTKKTAYRNLFFEHKGFLNITSASEGELSLGDAVTGTWFTENFAFGITEEYEHIDKNPKDGFVSWKEVFEYTRGYTMEAFRENYERISEKNKQKMKKSGQTSQRPKYFGQLPTRIDR